MVNFKVVLVWGSDDIFSQAVELLLAARTDWQVTRIPNGHDFEALTRAIITEKPDLIIAPQYIQDDAIGRKLVELLQQFPCIKVVTFNLENNLLDVYTRRNYVIHEASDLFSMFESSTPD